MRVVIASSGSTVPAGRVITRPTMSSTMATNSSLRAVKSVSVRISTMAAAPPSIRTPIRPWPVMRSVRPSILPLSFWRSHVSAAAMSPLFAVNAFLQSIMPSPVFARRAMTSFAVKFASVASISCSFLKRA